MPNQGRFELGRPPVHQVQEILGLQSDHRRRVILEKTERIVTSRALTEALEREGLGPVTPGNLYADGVKLMRAGLLGNAGHGLYSPTDRGRVAVSALADYRRVLIDPLLDTRLELLRSADGTDQALEGKRGQLKAGNSYPDDLMAIMDHHSDNFALAILLSTPLPDAKPATRQEIATDADKVIISISPSSFSRKLNGLIGQSLVLPQHRKRNSSYSLTTLGLASLRAYDTYQERVASVVKT